MVHADQLKDRLMKIYKSDKFGTIRKSSQLVLY
jgi:hypothetical protein